MSASRLHSWEAWLQGWLSLSRHGGPLLGFSAVVLGLHLLGWGLFAAADSTESAVLAAVLHLLGLALYGSSLLWMVEGLTRGGLAAARRKRISWRALWRWRGRRSGLLIRSLARLVAATGTTALLSFALWSLLLLTLPSLSLAAALLGLVATATVVLSQVLAPCLLLDARMSPAACFRAGVVLFERHWPGLLLLGALLLATLLTPPLVGLLAEAVLQGLGVVATVVACALILPVMASTAAHAYLQLQPELPRISPRSRGAR